MARSNNTARNDRLTRTLHNNARERGPAALASVRARLARVEERETRREISAE
jgi:hypothetical protein